tara:strand:+ start:371 stop:880 length:510 start_codon:yes stop_codon:yes gene_type:complete
MSKTDYYESDDYLISQIQDAANKFAIDYDELPIASINVIETLYPSHTSLNKMHAPELGYQVALSDIDTEETIFKEIYFDLEGRKLESEKEVYDCINLIFPVTFIMPDSSSIIVNSDTEEGWDELKSWYDNSDSKDWPEIQYPVDVIFENGDVFTVNSNDEMKTIKLSCN